MKKLVATFFLTVLISVTVFGQAPPTLRIVTESPDLPSELFYGDIKVKPLRLRPGTNQVITIADYDFFIQQQYIDFLRRFPEPEGMAFYLNILNGCHPSDIECIKFTRGALSANFFRSPEFQRKGSYVMYLYMVSVGQRPATVAELSDPTKVERPHYTEFMTDLGSISVPNDDPILTEQKKVALTDAWMQRPEIKSKYDALSNSAYAQKPVDTAGGSLTNQAKIGADWSAGTKPRAPGLRAIAESPRVTDKLYKQAV